MGLHLPECKPIYEFAPARMLVNSILAGAFCRAGIMGAEACRIVLYKILVNKYSACYNMQDVFCIHK